MSGSAHAPLADGWSVDSSRCNSSPRTGRRPPKTRYSRDLPPETLGWLYEMMVVTRELDDRVRQPAAPGRAGAVSRRVAARRPPRSVPRRACARPTGCSRSTASSAPSCVRGITPGADRARCGGAPGTAGWTSPRSAARPISIPIGTQPLHAVGAAMAAQRLGEDSVTVAFLGDGATSEGDVHEALNLAAVFRAPCIFYVQNNQWAISVPVSRQLAAPSIAHRAIGYGMPGIRVDGNDVLACYAVMAEAADRARAGGGPTLIEAVTYRMGPHTTSDDPTRYRSAGRTRSVGGPRSDRRATAPTCRAPGCGRSGSSSGSTRTRPGCEPSCATRCSTRPIPTSSRCSTTSTPRSRPNLAAQRRTAARRAGEGGVT